MPKILIVDNEPDELANLRVAAQSGKDRVVKEANSAAAAIDWIGRESFDVIITDLNMEAPTSGLKVLEAAIGSDPFAQVILVTAHGDQLISELTLQKGAFDYLDRMSPDIDIPFMIKAKITRALTLRQALLAQHSMLQSATMADLSATLFLNLWFAEHPGSEPLLPLERPSTLRVNLGPLMTSCLSPEDLNSTPLFDHLFYTIDHVEILVTSTGALVDRPIKKLQLPPGPDACVDFFVTPKRSDVRLIVTLLIRNEPIHRSSFLVRAVPPAPPALPESAMETADGCQ